MHDDRHGRLRHTAGDPRRRPPDGFRVRDRRRFRQLLDDAMLALPSQAVSALAGATVEVHDVPEVRTGPATSVTIVPVAQAQARGRRVQRLHVYRRAAELRAGERDDLVELLREAVLVAVADALGEDPDLWDGD